MTLDVLRNLSKKNKVYTTDSIDFEVSRYSRYTKKFLKSASPRFEEQNFIQDLMKIVHDYKIDVLVPLGEEVFYILRHKSSILGKCPNLKIIGDSFENLDLLHNKYSFYQLARENNLLTPDTYLIKEAKEVEDYVSQNKKVILKPIYSRYAAKAVVIDKDNLQELAKLDFNEKWIMQDYISGELLCTYSFHANNERLIFVSYSSELLPAIGPCVNLKLNAQNKEEKSIVDIITKKISFYGSVGFDFIKTDDGKLYVIECNPRPTTGIALTTMQCKIEDYMIHEQKQEGIAFNKVKIRDLMFLYAWRGYLKKKEIKKFMRILITYREIVLKWSDPFPYLAYELKFIQFKLKNKGIRFEDYITRDMSYNGEVHQL